MLSYGFGMPKTLTASLMAVIQTFYKIAPKGLTHLPGLSLVRQVKCLQCQRCFMLFSISKDVLDGFTQEDHLDF